MNVFRSPRWSQRLQLFGIINYYDDGIISGSVRSAEKGKSDESAHPLPHDTG